MGFNKKLTVFVCCHDSSIIYTDLIHRRLQMKRVERISDEDSVVYADIGDNIADRGLAYSEMVGLYWAWKNFKESEYVGFCHYRRYFSITFQEKDVDRLFDNGCDVVLVKPRFRLPGRLCYMEKFVQAEDVAIMHKVIQKLHPDYFEAYKEYAIDFRDFPFNMMICKKDLFDKYCEWIFSILFEMEKYVKQSSYSRAQRVLGYIAEFLTPIFFMKNGYVIKTMDYKKDGVLGFGLFSICCLIDLCI